MDWGDPPALWVPVERYAEAAPIFSFDILHSWGMESFLVSGRLRSGATVAEASAQVAALTARLRETQGRRQNQQAVLRSLDIELQKTGYINEAGRCLVDLTAELVPDG